MTQARGERSFLRHHGLTLVLLALFLGAAIGQVGTGYRDDRGERIERGEPAIDLLHYLGSGHCLEAFGENWESEFLQMCAFVYLTVFLFQRGSPESKDPDAEEAVDQDPRSAPVGPDTPWPVRRGGWVLALYEHSLGLACALLFLLSFAAHAWGGMHLYNRERLVHHAATTDFFGYLGSARFWFESLQNWQSEFLSIAAMVYLSVYLRERGSPESKAVAAPYRAHR
jgi:uncharacterized protein DUF6766